MNRNSEKKRETHVISADVLFQLGGLMEKERSTSCSVAKWKGRMAGGMPSSGCLFWHGISRSFSDTPGGPHLCSQRQWWSDDDAPDGSMIGSLEALEVPEMLSFDS